MINRDYVMSKTVEYVIFHEMLGQAYLDANVHTECVSASCVQPLR